MIYLKLLIILLITLSSELMEEKKKEDFEKTLKEYNSTQSYRVIHINTTFERLAEAIREIIDERDYEMQDILDDYLEYCYNDGLIPVSDSWKYLRMQLAGTTIDFNIRENVYYDNAERSFRAHDYLGLYKAKSVRAIGKIVARATAVMTDNGMQYETEFGELTDERKQKIKMAIDDGVSYGYDLKSSKHRYFFVDHFYKCDFKKSTPGPSRGTRIFDLTEILGTTELPDTGEIAIELANKTWE